jgi:alanine racemase
MLYGASPFVGGLAADEDLRPVMTFQTRLISVKRLRQGDPVGYGGTWVCPEDMDVGVAAVGYGDGYPRHAPSGTPVLVNGREAALIGRVSMDMITVDLRQHPEAKIGDPVVLWGQGLPVERIAQAAGTISYVLMCGITARVKVEVAEPSEPSGDPQSDLAQ